MCSPTLLISAASQGMKFMQARKQNRYARQQAQLQNWRAKKNRILKETAEDFKIRQKRSQALDKSYAMAQKGRKARATAFTSAEGISGKSVDALIMDYFRQEGEYTSRVTRNLETEAFMSQRAKEAYKMGQEFQSKPIPPIDIVPTFASSALNFAGDYYDWKAGEEVKLQKHRQAKYYRGGYQD
tara:strand:+ start:160 stop:711 length:552 start_codon:yes stop_codon:yes gene_type:complete